MEEKRRTNLQNRALHKAFSQIADELIAHGIDQRVYVNSLKEGLEIPFTAEMVKEVVWRPIQIAVTGKQSSADLSTLEVDKVFNLLSQILAKLGVEIYFPSIETMYEQSGEVR